MKPIHYFTLILVLAVVTGCNSGGSDTDNTIGSLGANENALSGYVADGYLQNATVFLDLNGNKELDSGEPQTSTIAGGYYELDPEGQDTRSAAVVVQVVAGVTVDEDAPSTPIASDYTLETPIGRHGFISPLTTLVKVRMEQNPGETIQDAEASVRLSMDLGYEVTLFDNFVKASNSTVSTQERVDARKCYNAARIVADLMEGISGTLQENLGSSFDTTEKQVLQFMAADRIVAQTPAIRTAVADGTAMLSESKINTVVSSVENQIDPASLNGDLVNVYQDRIDEGAETWDTTPPALAHCIPAQNQQAPVDTTITVVFDEELDPATIDNSCVTLTDGVHTITGTVQYNATLKTLTLTPSQQLNSFTTYTVQFSSRLSDQVGNAVSPASGWSFTTIFNETPPAPPSFS